MLDLGMTLGISIWTPLVQGLVCCMVIVRTTRAWESQHQGWPEQ